MRIELSSGVNLTVIQTTQFKTTRIEAHFLAPLTRQTVSARTLLTSVLETSTAAWPTQALMAAELERLFGASFGMGVSKEGRLHRVTAALTVLSDQFAQEALLKAAFAFLKAVVTAPLLVDGHFDDAVVTREKTNLLAYLASMSDDRQLQAALALQKAYFTTDEAQSAPSFGTIADLQAVTMGDLTAAYRQLYQTDQVELVVLGAVDSDQVLALAQALGLPARVDQQPGPIPYTQPLHPLNVVKEVAPVNQARLNLGYHVPLSLYGPTHFAALVANELFGGSPLSYLFTDVREKASKAYYASSSLEALRGFVMVQTGIDAADEEAVSTLIGQQLQKVQRGEFTAERLQAIKDGLVMNRLTASDNPRFLARQALLQALLPTVPKDNDDYIAAVQAVTREAVMAASADWQLQARYFLSAEV